MSDRKLEIVAGLIRGIMESCAVALAILEPESEPESPEPGEVPQRQIPKRLAYMGADEEPEPNKGSQ